MLLVPSAAASTEAPCAALCVQLAAVSASVALGAATWLSTAAPSLSATLPAASKTRLAPFRLPSVSEATAAAKCAVPPDRSASDRSALASAAADSMPVSMTRPSPPLAVSVTRLVASVPLRLSA